MTGSLLTSARDDSAWENASGGVEVPPARGNGNGEWGKVAYVRASAHLSPFPFPLSPSYETIHQRAQEHDDAHDPVHREERGVEPGQVSGLDEAVLVRDDRRGERHAHVVGGTEPDSGSECDERDHG